VKPLIGSSKHCLAGCYVQIYAEGWGVWYGTGEVINATEDGFNRVAVWIGWQYICKTRQVASSAHAASTLEGYMNKV
jgi:hypothetical protein